MPAPDQEPPDQVPGPNLPDVIGAGTVLEDELGDITCGSRKGAKKIAKEFATHILKAISK
jgi:hypothetical protein